MHVNNFIEKIRKVDLKESSIDFVLIDIEQSTVYPEINFLDALS